MRVHWVAVPKELRARRVNRLEEAISAYEAALCVNPNFVLAKNNLAVALTDLGTVLKTAPRCDLIVPPIDAPCTHWLRHGDPMHAQE
jgi:hypothetical protein|eukprot:COSAG01_NODE_8975_length_2597_cov_11.843875_2_plen_87_part_00